jgi:hypothetical protein
MRRLGVLLAAVLLTLAGCGVQPSGVIVGAAPPSGALDARTTVTLYLVAGGKVTPVTRSGGPLSRAETLALLAQGPNLVERGQGFTSEVPAEAAPFTLTADPSGRVVVTLSEPPAALSTLAVEQIACTAAPGRGQVLLLGANGDRGPVSCPVDGSPTMLPRAGGGSVPHG